MITQEERPWKERYEQLRQQALGQSDTLTSDRWGLALLLRHGVAGWMRAWQDPCACSEPPAGQRVPPPVLLPCSWQQEVTALLVNMALSHCHSPAPSRL